MTPLDLFGLLSAVSTMKSYPPPIAAVPINSVAPVTTSTKNAMFSSTKPKVMTRNFSAENSPRSESESMRQKHSKKRPASAKKTKGENREEKERNEYEDEAKYDFSQVPPPCCSCTGVARRCYKYGPGGWQSTCCTTSLSEYPLPMSPSRPGRRICGRKMKSGAYSKVLRKLATEGHNLSHPVDLKNHWGKHGSNKFHIIK